MALAQVVKDIAGRTRRVDEALRGGRLRAEDAAALTERYAFVYKDGPAPKLGWGRSGAAEPGTANDQTGTIWFTTSVYDEDHPEDRDGDVVLPRGRMGYNYANNPAWFFGHQQWEVPIGTGWDLNKVVMVEVSDPKLRQGCRFDRADPDADFIYGKVKRGMLNATSIAFVPLEAYRREPSNLHGLKAHPHQQEGPPLGWFFKRWDHTETSVVGVPSNAGALRDAFDREKSYLSPNCRKALWSYCARTKGCFNGWCPAPVTKEGGPPKGPSRRGQPCKPGETAASDGCKPASGKPGGPAASPAGVDTASRPAAAQTVAPSPPAAGGGGAGDASRRSPLTKPLTGADFERASKERGGDRERAYGLAVGQKAVAITNRKAEQFLDEHGAHGRKLTRDELIGLTELLKDEIAGHKALFNALDAACETGVCQGQTKERFTVELHNDDHTTAYLLRWGEGQQADWHDHGPGRDGAWVGVSVLEGPVENDFLTMGGKIIKQVLPEGRTVVLPAPYVHRMATDTDHATWSVHVYSGKYGGLRDMNFYKFDPATNLPDLGPDGKTPVVASEWHRDPDNPNKPAPAAAGKSVRKQRPPEEGAPVDDLTPEEIDPDKGAHVWDERLKKLVPLPGREVTGAPPAREKAACCGACRGGKKCEGTAGAKKSVQADMEGGPRHPGEVGAAGDTPGPVPGEKDLNGGSGAAGGYAIPPAVFGEKCPACSPSGSCAACGGTGDKGKCACKSCGGSGDCRQCKGLGRLQSRAAPGRHNRVAPRAGASKNKGAGMVRKASKDAVDEPTDPRGGGDGSGGGGDDLDLAAQVTQGVGGLVDQGGGGDDGGPSAGDVADVAGMAMAADLGDDPAAAAADGAGGDPTAAGGGLDGAPMTPQATPAAGILAGSYAHAKAEQDWLTQQMNGLGKLDMTGLDEAGAQDALSKHFALKAALDDYSQNHIPSRMELLRGLFTDHGGGDGDIDGMASGLLGAAGDGTAPPAAGPEGNPGEAGLVDLGDVPPPPDDAGADGAGDGTATDTDAGAEADATPADAPPAGGADMPSDPSTTEISERYQDKSGRWFTRKWLARKSADGRLFFVRKGDGAVIVGGGGVAADQRNQGRPPYNSAKDLALEDQDQGKAPFQTAKDLPPGQLVGPDDDQVNTVKEAGDFLDELSGAQDVPKHWKQAAKGYGLALKGVHKALNDKGHLQSNGGGGRSLQDKGREQRNGGAGSPLANTGNPQELKPGTKSAPPGRGVSKALQKQFDDMAVLAQRVTGRPLSSLLGN